MWAFFDWLQRLQAAGASLQRAAPAIYRLTQLSQRAHPTILKAETLYTKAKPLLDEATALYAEARPTIEQAEPLIAQAELEWQQIAPAITAVLNVMGQHKEAGIAPEVATQRVVQALDTVRLK
jgi:F0F1-type ATP synthase membrane subunit b/b'